MKVRSVTALFVIIITLLSNPSVGICDICPDAPDICASASSGDHNCDGIVDLIDIATLAKNWLIHVNGSDECAYNCQASYDAGVASVDITSDNPSCDWNLQYWDGTACVSGGLCQPGSETDLSTGQVYIVIHCDPHGADAICGTPGNGQWDQLVEIVTAAGDLGHKLTLLMAADWAFCITTSAVRQATLAQWLSDGHQLGYHHHDCSHPHPDGYRADGVANCDALEECDNCKEALKGTTDESLAYVAGLENQMIALGVPSKAVTIDTANMGPDNWCDDHEVCFRDYEWDLSLIWGMEKVSENPARGSPMGTLGTTEYSFLTTPQCRVYGDGTQDLHVLETGHAQLDVANFRESHADNSYQTIASELLVLKGGIEGVDVVNMGIVFHPQEFISGTVLSNRGADDPIADNDKDYLLAIFALLADQGHLGVTVREVMTAQTTTCP